MARGRLRAEPSIRDSDGRRVTGGDQQGRRGRSRSLGWPPISIAVISDVEDRDRSPTICASGSDDDAPEVRRDRKGIVPMDRETPPMRWPGRVSARGELESLSIRILSSRDAARGFVDDGSIPLPRLRKTLASRSLPAEIGAAVRSHRRLCRSRCWSHEPGRMRRPSPFVRSRTNRYKATVEHSIVHRRRRSRTGPRSDRGLAGGSRRPRDPPGTLSRRTLEADRASGPQASPVVRIPARVEAPADLAVWCEARRSLAVPGIARAWCRSSAEPRVTSRGLNRASSGRSRRG